MLDEFLLPLKIIFIYLLWIFNMNKLSKLLACAGFFVHSVSAQVANTPPSHEPNFNVDMSVNGPGLNRNGRVARYPNWVYPANEDVLAPWRVDRGFVLPSQIRGLLSSPYHATGLSMNQFSSIPPNYTGHVPVYSEGNYWPFVGPAQLHPNNQGVNRDLNQDAGLYFVNGQVVATQEPLFVQGDNRLKAVNETPHSFLITAGSFPGTEQPGQVMNVLNPGETITVPLAPDGWWPDSVVPETYSSVAGLNPLHAPGWHHSSWSPSEYPGGIQARDFGTPGFAYNLDPNVDYKDGITKNILFAGLRSAEGYDPLISGDPGYGISFYVDNELRGVIDMVKTDDYNAIATLVAHNDSNPRNAPQGPITVASAVFGVPPSQQAEYRYITHSAAQSLIAENRGRPNWSVITQAYDSNPNAFPAATEVDPVLVGNDGTLTPGATPAPMPSPNPVQTPGSSPGTSTIRIEAEHAELLGGATINDDQAASNMQFVGSTFGEGKGIRFNNVQASSGFSIAYASEVSGSISYLINGQYQGKINFNASGAWVGQYTEVNVSASIPANSSLTLVFNSGDAAMNYDYVEFMGTSSSTDNPVGQTDAKYDPGPGKTVLLIGQNVWGEYDEYVNLFSAPAGSSHYGSVYSGTIRGGIGPDTDANSQTHFNNVNANFPGSYSLIALNIKDNPSEADFSSVAAALAGIENGELDLQIDTLSQTLSEQPDRKFILRIGYEVSTSVFGSGSAYARAFNYIANRIRNTNQIFNVDFLYHPNYQLSDAESLYPGSEFVDFIGFSVFNSAVCMPVASQTFCAPGDRINPALVESLEWVRQQNKAFMIPESSPRVPAVNSASEYNEYLARLFDVVETYDARFLSFISTDWPGQNWPTNEWGDSRLGRFAEVENNWRDRINDTRFLTYDEVNGSIPITTPSSAPVDTPAPMPIQGQTVRIEAESGDALNGAMVSSDSAASGGSFVSFIMTSGRGVRFYNVPASDHIQLGYASNESGRLSIFVNDINTATIPFSSNGVWQGSWVETSVDVVIPQGAKVEVLFQSGSVNIDYVDFVRFGSNTGPQPTPTPGINPSPTPAGIATPNSQPLGSKPAIPVDGERYFILGQDQFSIQEYMEDLSLPRPNGLTMYVTLSRGESSYDNSYCFKGLDGLKHTNNYNSNTAIGCAPGDTERRNHWGSGVQNVQWAIETYAPSIVSIGMWCPTNDRLPSLYNNGAYDDLLAELADFFKTHSATSFFLRTCYEFNGDAGGWSDVNFRQTFKYIRTFLDSQNVTNVAHVWQSDSFHGTGRGTAAIGDMEQGYWPGRRYVDWVGSSQFDSAVDEEAAIAEAEGLPHFIAESTPHGMLFHQYDFKLAFNTMGSSPDGSVTLHNDLDWFNNKRAEISRSSTKAWHYINADWSSQPQWANAPDQAGQNFFKYTDSRIQQNGTIRNHFINYVSEQNGFILGDTAMPTPLPTAIPTVMPTANPTLAPTLAPTAMPSAIPTALPTRVPTPLPTQIPTAVPTSVATPAVMDPVEWETIVHKPTGAKIYSCETTTVVSPVGSRLTPEVSHCAQWTRIKNGSYFHIQSRFSGYFLKPDTADEGSPVTLAPTEWVGPWTQWEYVETGDGFGYLVSRGTGKRIFLSAEDNADISMQPASWAGDFTRWKFEPVIEEPMPTPTVAPTLVPTLAPTAVPTVAPTMPPTVAPTAVPTTVPTTVPTAVPTVVPTRVPTANPTAVPTIAPTSLPEPVLIEAENGELLNGTISSADATASGGAYAAFIMTNGRGVRFFNTPAANRLTMGYASDQSGTISILVNGNDLADFNFIGNGVLQGAWVETSVDIDIPQNATVEVIFRSGDTALNIDYVVFNSISSTIPNRTPTPRPISTPNNPDASSIEAEHATLTGGAQVYDDLAASGGSAVGFISSVGAGIRFDNTPESTSISVAYASEMSGSISVYVNDVDVGAFEFAATGAWVGPYQSRDLTMNLAAGDSLSFQFDDGDTALNVDQITFSTANQGTTVTPSPTPAPVVPSTVKVDSHSEFGRFLVGGEQSTAPNFTLYTFAHDNAGTSVCNGNCAVVWPPLTISSESDLVVPLGVTGLGVQPRDDGTLQVSLEGEPLYFYRDDLAPGDFNGNGLSNGAWQVAELPAATFTDLTWEKAALPACADLYSNIPTWGYHTYISGTTLHFKTGGMLTSEILGDNLRAVFFRTSDATGTLEHIGTVEGPITGNASTLSIPSEYLSGKVTYYVSHERFFTPMSEPGKTGNALQYADTPLYALNREQGCVSGNWSVSAVEDFAGWSRRQHPQGVFNDHNVFSKSTSSIQNTATHFMHVPRFVVEVVQDAANQDLIFDVTFVYEAESDFNNTTEVIYSAIEGKEARAGDGSPRHVYSNRCFEQSINVYRCNLGQVFAYGQTIDWELRLQPVGGLGANLYSQMFYYVPGYGWTRESSDPRALLGGYASIDAHGATVYERAAAFMQHQHTDDLTKVRDFVRDHQTLRNPIGSPLHGARFDTCEACHINDGRSDVAFTLPSGERRIAPPLIGLGLLEQIQDFPGKVGFGWEGARSTVEDAVRFALSADFGVTAPDTNLVNKLTTYSQFVGVPQRDKSTLFEPNVIAGETLFKGTMQCVACHQEQQQLVSGDVIRPYTDMKAWDIGTGGTFRTAPLWGIGRSANVVYVSLEEDTGLGYNNAEAPGLAQRTLGNSVTALRFLPPDSQAIYLHDGRANSLDAAIRAHEGDAAPSGNAYINATQLQRNQLLEFLRSL